MLNVCLVSFGHPLIFNMLHCPTCSQHVGSSNIYRLAGPLLHCILDFTLPIPHSWTLRDCFIVLQLFAPKCKVIRERDTKSHARHIPFSVPTHTQRLTKASHNTGNFTPCSFRIVCGFFNVPQWSYINMEGIWRDPRYPRRLESLTIYWFNYKGSTFYSVILRPWVLVQPESNSRPLAWQPDVPPLSHQHAVSIRGSSCWTAYILDSSH